MAGRSTLSANATKRQKFAHYANIRIDAAITAIDNLAKLASNPRDYEFSKADGEKLYKTALARLDAMKAAFDNPGKPAAKAGAVIE
jgi:hypothetical protein